MRTVSITIVAAFVVLLGLQLTAASRGPELEERGASQAVIAGSIKCFFEPEVHVGLETFGGLGILAIPRPPEQFSSFAVFAGPLAEECSDLIPFLVEQFPRRICEIGGTFQPGEGVEVPFVCTGRADVVISAVGQMAEGGDPTRAALSAHAHGLTPSLRCARASPLIAGQNEPKPTP